MSRALIAGCGYVGRPLAERLVAEGVDVFALRRREVPPGDGITWLQADLGKPAELSAALAPLEASGDELDVYYLVSADGFGDDAYRLAYVDGLAHLLAALAGRPLRRLLFASSTAVYHQSDGGWVDEGSPTEPETFSGRRLLEGEALARACETTAVVVRYGGIYGPGRTRLIDRIVDGEALVDPKAARYRSRMHRDDCAAAMAHLAKIERPAPIYVGADDDPADMRDVERWLCAELGRSVSSLRPAGAPRRGGHKRCRNRLLRDAGLALDYPSYRDGYGALLDELGLR